MDERVDWSTEYGMGDVWNAEKVGRKFSWVSMELVKQDSTHHE